MSDKMELTPRKSTLKSTPKKGGETPKQVRFSTLNRKSPLDCKNVEGKIFSAEQVLSMLNDNSLSDIDNSSSDEEWIVTKAKGKSSLPDPSVEVSVSSNVFFTNSRNENEVVSPLKLLRRPEYEINKVSNSKKKSVSAVSPIVIKRKTDGKKTPSKSTPSSQPLAPSAKCNTLESVNTTEIDYTPRKSRISKCIQDGSDTENEIITPIKKNTPRNKKQVKSKEVANSATKKETRRKTDLEDSFEEKISNLQITDSSEKIKPKENHAMEWEPARNSPKRTPAKKKLNTSDSEMEAIVSPPKRRSTRSAAVSSPIVRRSSRKSTSQYKAIMISASDDSRDESPLKRKPVGNTMTVISDSDDEVQVAKSPLKRKSIRNTKSNEKKEESDIEVSSPEVKKTPRRSATKPRESYVDSPSLRRQVLTPRMSARKKLELSSPSSVKKVGSGFLSPVINERARRNILDTPDPQISETRTSLHTSNIPTSLPCREKELDNILKFLSRKIEDKSGGCMYISGVPGTGKTATVHAVVRILQKEALIGNLPKFDFVEINALRLTEPRQAYIRIWRELSGEKLSADAAMKALEKKFTRNNKRPCVVLIDELDYLCNRRQDVIYNILEWSTMSTAALTVLTIANTMDLPERTLKGKVTSRMGLTRLVFQPYTFQQLQLIVMNRIGENSSFHVDAVQLVARKVAAVSGDARRALDICRRVTEMVPSDAAVIKVADIEKAIAQIFSGTRVLAIKRCSVMCQYILRAMRDEFQRTGVEESTIGQVYTQFCSICAFEGCEAPSVGIVLSLSTYLANSGLILAEKARTDLSRKVSLNVSADDIFYACNA